MTLSVGWMSSWPGHNLEPTIVVHIRVQSLINEVQLPTYIHLGNLGWKEFPRD